MLPDLTVLLALLVGLASLGADPVDPWRAGLGTLASISVGIALTWMAGRRGLRGIAEGQREAVAAAVRWLDLWPLLAWVAAVAIFGWGRLVVAEIPRTWWLGRYAVLFAPAAVLFAAGWLQRGRIEVAAAGARGTTLPLPRLADTFTQALRRNGLALFPLLVVLGLLDGIWLLGKLGVPGFSTFARWMEVLPLLNLGVMLGVLSLLVLGLPAMFRRLLSTEPMAAGPGRQLLERQAARLNLKYRDILVWKTRGLALNAMVMGFTRQTRLIFLTDALLRYLPDEEVLAVFSHEAGHAKRHHLQLFLVLFVSAAVLFLVVGEIVEARGIDPLVVLVAHLAFIWFVLFGSVSRVFEREADVYGADHAAALDPDADAVAVLGLGAPLPAGAAWMVRALERIRRLSGRGTSHRHGTIEERVAFVAAQATEPAVRETFARRLKRLRLLIAGAFVLALVAAAWRLPAEIAEARTWLLFEDAVASANTATEAQEAGREGEARTHWEAALLDFEDVAKRLIGHPGERERNLRFWALFNAADSAVHGLGDEARGLAGFLRTLAFARDGDLPAEDTRTLRFQAWIDTGRILARRGDLRAFVAWTRAKEIYGALPSEGRTGRRMAAYWRSRLHLLEAVLMAHGERMVRSFPVSDPLGLLTSTLRHDSGRLATARAWLTALEASTPESAEWDELRRDARLELERSARPGPDRRSR